MSQDDRAVPSGAPGRSAADHADLLAEAERVGRMGSWVVGPGNRIAWSDNLFRIFGLEPGTPPGQQAFDALIHPDDRARVAGMQHGVFAPDGPRTFDGQEYRIIRPDGEIRWVRGAGTATRDASGALTKLVGTITDITDEVHTRQALQDAHRMLESAERIAHVGSFVWEPATRDGVYSPEFMRILGLPREAKDRVLTGWIELLHPDDRDVHARWFADVLRNGTAPPLRARIVRDGSIGYVEVRGVVQAGADGSVTRVFGTMHDVTERVGLEQGLQDAARLEAIGNVAAGVAHDLNNYLTVLQGAIDLLGGGANDDAWRAGQRAMEQCTSLTRNLLSYARNQPFTPVDLDLGAVLLDAAALLRRLVGSAIEVIVEVPDHALFARADRGHVENVLVNLGVNARDAMPDGGVLRLSVDRPAAAEVRDTVATGSEVVDWVRVIVEDNGVGIEPEDLERIFEPFFTTKRSGGTGLGLPSVHSTIRQHGGHVKVRSAPGHGTRFEAWLPAAHPEGWEVGPTPQGRTVLVVDDVSEVRELASRFLHRGGWRTVEAGGVDEALAVLAQGGIDVVLSDLVMPDRSGFELLRAVRALAVPVPVVLMTGYSHGEDDVDVPVVRKPFRQADLLATLELVVRPRSNP